MPPSSKKIDPPGSKISNMKKKLRQHCLINNSHFHVFLFKLVYYSKKIGFIWKLFLINLNKIRVITSIDTHFSNVQVMSIQCPMYISTQKHINL